MSQFLIVLDKSKKKVPISVSMAIKDQFELHFNNYDLTGNISTIKMKVKNVLARVVVKSLENKDTKNFPSREFLIDIRLKDDTIQIKPINLYTLLLFHGLFVPYIETINKNSYKDKNGLIYYHKNGFSEVLLPEKNKGK